MKTQIEQLKQATRCYIITISERSNSMIDRYQVYTQKDNEQLQVLWPDLYDSEGKELTPNFLPYQKYSNRRQYPAYHFVVNGCGLDKRHAIAYELRKVSGNDNLEFLHITGHSPSPISL